jgi:hypothetical protein
MSVRNIKKNLIHFARREYREKRPLSVQVLRVKDEKILTSGGPLKIFIISEIKNPYYLVLVEYTEQFRIYYYSKNGVSLGARNFEHGQKLMDQIKKTTIMEYKLPK